MASFRENLVQFRKIYGLTQAGLAEAIGVSRISIAKYESGEMTPKTEELIALSNVLRHDFVADFVGERIKEVRKATGVTQEELAEILGVSHATVGRYEHGETDITVKRMWKIADALGCSMCYLLGAESKGAIVGVTISVNGEEVVRWLNVPDDEENFTKGGE